MAADEHRHLHLERLDRDDVIEMLKKLCDPAVRKEIEDDPATGIRKHLRVKDIHDDLLSAKPLLPPVRELEKAIATLERGDALSFSLEPFGMYTPGMSPFICAFGHITVANQPTD